MSEKAEKAKVWQASIWVGAYEDTPVTLFGESINDLRETVATWIIENEPNNFGNSSPSYEITRRYNYSQATPDNPIKNQSYNSDELITEGWIGVDGSDRNWNTFHRFNDVESVANHFVNVSMIPYKGLDWKEIPAKAGVFPLHKIRIVKRVEEELELNDHLQRGWYLLTLEYSGTSSYNSELIDRKIIFLIGHPEEDADFQSAPTAETHHNHSF